jgi:hypothetical protein
MERISQTEAEKEAEEERVETSPLGAQVDNYLGTDQELSHHSVVDNEQYHKLPGSPQGSSGHGDAGTQEYLSLYMNQEPGNDDTEEPNTKTSASAPS